VLLTSNTFIYTSWAMGIEAFAGLTEGKRSEAKPLKMGCNDSPYPCYINVW